MNWFSAAAAVLVVGILMQEVGFFFTLSHTLSNWKLFFSYFYISVMSH